MLELAVRELEIPKIDTAEVIVPRIPQISDRNSINDPLQLIWPNQVDLNPLINRRLPNNWQVVSLGIPDIGQQGNEDESIEQFSLTLVLERLMKGKNPSEDELFLVLMMHARNYSQSVHENRKKIYDAYGVAPFLNEPERGVKFQGYWGKPTRHEIAQGYQGSVFQLKNELCSAVISRRKGRLNSVISHSNHTQSQIANAHEYLPHLPSMIEQGQIIRSF